MGLEQKLSLRLSQRLVMTPTLQQAIKLLQMTRLELQDVVNQELVSNPVLDEEDADQAGGPDEEPGAAETRELDLASSADAPDAALEAAVADDREFAAAATDADARAESAEALPAPTSDVIAPEPVVDSSTGATDDPFSDLELEAYFGDYMEGTATAPRMNEESEEFSLENRPESPPGLEPHLTEQLGVSDAPPDVREACGFLIGNVDPDGCLRVTLEETAEAVPCSIETAEKALALLQSFDPVGVGGRSLAEILLLQARAANVATPLLVELVTQRFAELGSKPPALLARQMGVPVEDIQQALEWIRRLDPKPGRRYDSTRTIYVEPDVAVVKVEDDYIVVFNDDGLPRLKVSALYRRMLLSRDGNLDSEGKSYLREKMRAAQWLLKSLDQRKRTIVRVAESIVKKQRDFLDWGVAHLKPLVLRDVAEDIGMHESTVSRVVSNKWMATPRGLVPMKFFFHSAIASTGGEDVSSLAVKNKIRGLIEAEDGAHPLSDARLAELLAHEGIQIARRTVAKYREELRIPASSIRRTGETAPAFERPEGAVDAAAEDAAADAEPSEQEEP
ncbi:MAG TPA: RNA polymerase factor sigma-54 [Thermoanaerobaculia bacterium]|nr:RNA polymerase factor sigma-54 [Thermoanaerobaculia bacterium]